MTTNPPGKKSKRLAVETSGFLGNHHGKALFFGCMSCGNKQSRAGKCVICQEVVKSIRIREY